MHLIETTKVQVTILESDQSAGTVKFTAVVSEADFLNRNRRCYPESVLFPAFEACNKKIKEGLAEPGLVDHPEGYAGPSVSDIGIAWESFSFEGKKVIGVGRTVPTARGKDLAAAMQAGVAVGFSTRGRGQTEDYTALDGMAAKRMTQYELDAVDAVLAPSVAHARVQSFTKEQTEQMEEKIKELEAALAEALARVAELEPAVAQAESASARVAELEAVRDQTHSALTETLAENEALKAQLAESAQCVAEAAAVKAEAAFNAALDELVGEHRFAASIKNQIADLRAKGVTILAEQLSGYVDTFRTMVEAVAAASAQGIVPRGDVSSDEDRASKRESEAQEGRWTPEQIEEQRAAGLRK